MPPSPTVPSPSAVELENFFGNASCSWPCWQGITPGVTTSSEALQRLNNSSLVLKNTIQAEEPKTGFGKVEWHWKIGDKQPILGGDIEWRDGFVWKIALTAYYIISLGEMINKFGPPEKVEVINCTEIVEGPQYWCATLYYARNGFEIHVNWNRNENGMQIMPSDPIDFVLLFKPSTIEEWLSSWGFDPQNHDLRDWKGYGNFYNLYVR